MQFLIYYNIIDVLINWINFERHFMKHEYYILLPSIASIYVKGK